MNLIEKFVKLLLRQCLKVNIKRTIAMIVSWDKYECNTKSIIHIHSKNDHTLPVRNITADYIIPNGSHMMTLTRGREIETILKQLLEH